MHVPLLSEVDRKWRGVLECVVQQMLIASNDSAKWTEGLAVYQAQHEQNACMSEQNACRSWQSACMGGRSPGNWLTPPPTEETSTILPEQHSPAKGIPEHSPAHMKQISAEQEEEIVAGVGQPE